MRFIFMSLMIVIMATVSVNAGSYKKDYCKNNEYFDNNGADDGSHYPHLHCDKKWITYSKAKKSHSNFLKGSRFDKGKANNVCGRASKKIKKVIKEICEDMGETCNSCN